MTDPQPGSSASSAAPVDALLSRWDAARHHGQTISPEELCRDCPQYLAELQSRIDGLQVMERFMAKAGPARDDSLPLSASDAETGFNGPALKTVEEAKSCLSPPRGPDEIGWLGSYRVRKVLGAGGMGVVLLAEDSRLKRQVAVKVMAPSLAANASARERFLREAQAAAALEHEHIVAIHQVDEHNNVPYLVMPFLKGESLEDRLTRVGRLELLDAVRIAREIAEGLAAAHEHGLIHRDIKPGNIWLETRSQRSGIRNQESGVRGQGSGMEKTEIRETPTSSDQWLRTKVERVKILDFGLARAERDDVHLTRTGEVLGTPAYMCPEQAAGEVVDQRGDLFSLGAVVYRMVTGQRPFAGDTIFAMMNSLANQQPQAPEKLNPETPPPLSRLILRLLEKERSRRPASALEVANELAGIEATCFEETEVQGSATTLPSIAPQSLPQPPERRPRKPRTAIAIAALAAIALVAAGIIVIIRDREGNEVGRIKVPKDGSVIIEQKGKPPIVIPEKPAAKAKDPHRRAAEMVLKNGGTVTVAGRGGVQNGITRLEDLPAEPFVLYAVQLVNTKVSDDALEDLAKVSYLMVLNLAGTPIGDAGVNHLKDMDVTELNLSNTKVTDAGLPSILRRPELVVLQLGGTLEKSFALEKCASLSSLRFLALDSKLDPLAVKALASAKRLNQLSLIRALTVAELAQLRELSGLRRLGLSGRDTTDALVEDLAKLKQLSSINLSNTQITDEAARRLQSSLPNALVYHPGVKQTDAARAALRWVLDAGGVVSGDAEKGTSSRLQTVPIGQYAVYSIDFSKAGPVSGAAKLTSVRELQHLTWPNLKNADTEAEDLARLSGLASLVLSSSDLTAKGLKKLTEIHRLDQLRLNSCLALDGGAWQHLPAFDVYLLSLDSTAIDDQGLEHVGACARLQTLFMNGCSKITPSGLNHLAKLPTLRFLQLAYNQLADDAIVPLKKLSSLRLLHLHGTKVTAAGIAELRKALPKCAIFWDGPAVIPGAEETAATIPVVQPPAKAKDPHRRAAEMVLKHGGTVTVLTPYYKEITQLENLPAEPFALYRVYHPGKTIPDYVLKALAELAYLFDLNFPSAATGDAVLREMKQTDLAGLGLAGAKVTAEGAELLLQRRGLVSLHAPNMLGTTFSFEKMASLSSLRFLALHGWKTTPAGLRALTDAPLLDHLQGCGAWTGAEIAQLQKLACLRQLDVITVATDNVIDDLAKLKQVSQILLHNTLISDEGARRLQKALPNALIDHPGIDRTEAAHAALRWALDSGGAAHGFLKDNAVQVPLPKTPKGRFLVESISFTAGGPGGGAAKLLALPELRRLTWHDLNNADAEAEHLAALSGLQSLQLRSSDITAKGVKKLMGLRRLEQLELSSCSKLAGDAWQHLPALNVLYLALHGTPVDDQGLAHIAACSQVHDLTLNSCSKITVAGLDHLSKLPALRILHLAYNPLSDDAITPLKKLSSVRILDLQGTKLTAAGIAELRKALPKCAIFWDGPAVIPGAEEPATTIPVVQPPAKAKDPHRRAAEMVLKHGGTVDVTGPFDKTITKLEDLPAEPFALAKLSLSSKTFPNDSLKDLAGVSYLPVLNLGSSSVGDLGIRYLKGLAVVEMNLAATEVTDEGLRIVARGPDLFGLRAGTTGGFLAVDTLPRLPSLRQLSLIGKTDDIALKRLVGAKSLRSLRLGSGWTPNGLAHLKNVVGLRGLDLHGTPASDDDIDTLAGLNQLCFLRLSGTKISTEGARRLQKALPNVVIQYPGLLRTDGARQAVRLLLASGGNAVGLDGDVYGDIKKVPAGWFLVDSVRLVGGLGDDASKLAALRELDSLGWSNLKNADAEVEHLAALDLLRDFRLSSPDLSSKGLKTLMALEQLDALHLSDCPKLIGGAWQHLAASKLRILSLNGCSIDDQALTHIGASAHLQHLYLTACPKVTFVGLDHLANLPTLRLLHLGNTTLSDNAVTPLKKLSSLRLLYLQNTQVTAAGIAELRKALPKCAIFWDGPAVIPGAEETAATIPVVQPPAKAKDPHRRAAEMVLKHGGTVDVVTPQSKSITQLEKLPAEPFALLRIYLPGKTIPDEALKALAGVSYLIDFSSPHAAMGDAVMRQLNSTELTGLNLSGAMVTDKGSELLLRRPGLVTLFAPSTLGTKFTLDKMASLSSLRFLSLGDRTSTPAGLKGLADARLLGSLHISSTWTGAELAELRILPCLRELVVFGPTDDLVDDLAKLKQVTYIQLHGTRITDEGARRLQKALPNALIYHPGINRTDSARTALRWVLDNGGAAHGSFKDDSVRVPLQKVPVGLFSVDTVTLSAGSSGGGAAKLVALPELRRLRWQDLKNADAEAEHLAALSGLQDLQLSSTDISAKGLKKLTALRRLEQLQLAYCSMLADDAWQHLPAFNVSNLSLDHTPLADQGLAHVAACTHLQALALNGCSKITAAGLDPLSKLPMLRYLELAHTQLTDDAVAPLKKLSSVRILYLHGTKVTAAGIAELRKALPKCAIFWDGPAVIPGAEENSEEKGPVKQVDPKSPNNSVGNVDQGKPSFTNSIGMKLMAIPAGEFLMGSAKDEADYHDFEGPRHRVVFSRPFFMSAHEVTQEQYQKIMGKNPSANKEDPSCPVEKVSWENAVDFCERLSLQPEEKKFGRVYRLPTEAEWEYACRAGTTTPFHFGASLSTAQANFGALLDFGKVEKGAPGKTVKVGSYPPNAWGLFDMHGNVREWCLDGARPYKKTDDGIANPLGPINDGLARACRGGHFSTSAAACRSAFRQSVAPLARQPVTGFRVVCTQPPLGPGQ